MMTPNAQYYYGAQQLGNAHNQAAQCTWNADFQVRKMALEMAFKMIGDSTGSASIIVDEAKKLEAYLRGETDKKQDA